MLCGTCAIGVGAPGARGAPGAFGASARVSPRHSCATSNPSVGRCRRGATAWRAAATRGDDALTGRDRESRDTPRRESARRAGARGSGSRPGATGTSVAERVSADSETRRAESPSISEEIVVEAPSAPPPARDPTEALAVEERRDEQPSRPSTPPRADGRRLFMAALASAVVAETAGQVVERTMISESARLRLEQKRRVIRGSIQSAGLEFEDRPRGGDAIGKEVKRASAIAALAALGAVGSRVIMQAKRGAVVAADAVEAARSGSFDSIDEGDACLTGGTCAPNWSVDEDDEDEDAARTTASTPESSPAGALDLSFFRPLEGWTSEDVKNVAKTVIFSACYGGLFQPHWFNVLNSYDWSAIILPRQLELQLAQLQQQLMLGQAMAGVSAAPETANQLRLFLESAGGYGDPSMVAAVSLSLAAPLEAAGQSLAPLAVNQLMAIPLLYWPSFFLFTGAVEGQSLSVILETLWQRLPGLMRANLAFWLPAQGFQFSQVPAEDQAIYVAVMGVLWNGVLAAMTAPKVTGAATYGAAAGEAEKTAKTAEEGAETAAGTAAEMMAAEMAASNAVAGKVRTADAPARSR